MPIEIFIEKVNDVEGNRWVLNSDLICHICGKRQPMSYSTCNRCGEKIKYSLVIVDGKYPVVLDNDEEVKTLEDYLQSLCTVSKLLGYKIESLATDKLIHININRGNKDSIGFFIYWDEVSRILKTSTTFAGIKWQDVPRVQITFDDKMICLKHAIFSL